jgi:hypothetical protein
LLPKSERRSSSLLLRLPEDRSWLGGLNSSCLAKSAKGVSGSGLGLSQRLTEATKARRLC